MSDLATRIGWAREHAVRLSAMLEAPTIKDVARRIWRTTWWLDDRMQAVALNQVLRLPPGVDADQAPRLVLQITTDSGGNPSRTIAMPQGYDIDELIAFCRLDEIDPASVTWRDATNYREILVVDHLPRAAQARRLSD